MDTDPAPEKCAGEKGAQKILVERKNIFGNEGQKKVFIANASQWRRSYCFLLGHNFRFGGTFSLGAQKPPLVRILPSHSGVKTKNKMKRSLSQMHPNGVDPVAFFWGTFVARLGAQKSPLVRILPSHSGVKTKNKTKRSLSQMHPNGVGLVAFFWGTFVARLGVTAPK